MKILNYLGIYKMRVKWICRLTPQQIQGYKSSFKLFFPYKTFVELDDKIRTQWCLTFFKNPRDVAISWNQFFNRNLNKTHLCVTAWYN
jgi:hypothetical protein